jgi:hypothetical protein
MNRTEIKKVLNDLTAEIDLTADRKVASILKTLVNLVEILVDKNSALEHENQNLKNEVNRLKGEQGKPDIRKQTKEGDDSSTNHSSEADRKKRGRKSPRKLKTNKKKTIKINRQITCEIDKNSLPNDAEFKGYETRIFQDLKILTDNIEFRLPTYYSSSLRKTFIAALPKEYHGEFGPGIRTLVITLYRDSGMTEPAIERFFRTFNIQISKSTISRMITDGHDDFHHEKEAIIDAGLKANPYQHMDDTSCRVNGKNHYTHILCNPYFTAFFTRPKKDRLTLLEILCRGKLKFEINNNAYALMTELGLSNKRLTELKKMTNEGKLTHEEMDHLLIQLFPNPKKHASNRRIIHEAAAITYYHASGLAIEHLICDDAPQFNKIAKNKSLCWIHEGRHYKKLNPIFYAHRKAVDNFIEQFWDYYEALLTYQQTPSVIEAQELSKKFDNLFLTKTGYDLLDSRIAMTLTKKESLLLVLTFPFLLLHNNPAELGARVQARIRDINLQTISENGTKSKDTFATIVQTAKKLGVNIYDYVFDRVTKKFNMTSLAILIAEKSTPLPYPI